VLHFNILEERGGPLELRQGRSIWDEEGGNGPDTVKSVGYEMCGKKI